ncbi:DNase I-like protein [Rozella allomycis CSF55]|uniref:DNase I-like protein n=1 Tax=Rozella allomycis (strain CSF55) TaxID=988480 RepID=A0A4P9YG07_ROZAC|nr:DNase I-like protein [Rozella allomycis CSF55]
MSIQTLVLLLGLLLLAFVQHSSGYEFTFGAMNLNVFGVTKLNDSLVTSTISTIITRYDVFLAQEIRDISGSTPSRLLSMVNNLTSAGYELVASDHLGKSSSKEQYVYFYRKDRAVLIDQWQYDGIAARNFERPPFCVLMSFGHEKVVFIGLHAKPAAAIFEINSLKYVYDEVLQRWGESNIMIMGDLNADCQYVRKKHWHLPKSDSSSTEDEGVFTDSESSRAKRRSRRKPKNLAHAPIGYDEDDHGYSGDDEASERPKKRRVKQKRSDDNTVNHSNFTVLLYHDTRLHWLIETSVDTTTSISTCCAFDRIIASTSAMRLVVPNSAKPYYYPCDIYSRETSTKKPWHPDNACEKLKLDLADISRISDHFPVEVKLNIKPNLTDSVFNLAKSLFAIRIF